MTDRPALSRREREILDVIYAQGEATAAQVREGLASPPSYSAVRALLRVMVDKGHLAHTRQQGRLVYRATVPRAEAARRALGHLRRTFFGGSAPQLVSTLLQDESLDADTLDALAQLVERARSEEAP